ncbi:MAG: hypothetical protein COT39_02240 [Parcubacteria group bacterium CG08_land_8_20_14_0_20_48_21]|nr:MAG: hypothetical protein AUK21_01555 [Parcubacteria group bacterium CG2_30_48_51]PIS32885.1 MAG: hypothetical protein COT39_02240 [Parcubacteria group bacterium CG08_land_8_20_14_0_20_48_21]PIW78777.1 MAG: hypothetical protein COZ99_04510 [Parcubacteria group bacterium CG_4_8_14_3_um_filter_48_16]PIY78254.1 MAG: hypothetical protein COY83_00880 [Parcubacteria group bacterium CG_4_10_14_0_8_um_filter_48_154]PIZ77605.1 MAG: hypothetical protein COY03_02265 [bacterium CG_4_10_14_0_2_um_filter_
MGVVLVIILIATITIFGVSIFLERVWCGTIRTPRVEVWMEKEDRQDRLRAVLSFYKKFEKDHSNQETVAMICEL